jgi:hypothetical protein
MNHPEIVVMVETTKDGSGWVWIRKHTRLVHGVFRNLRSWRMRSGGGYQEDEVGFPAGYSMIETVSSVSKQRFKLLQGNPCLFEYLGKSGSFDRIVRRNGQFEHFHPCMLMQTNMASSLADDHPAITLKRLDHLLVAPTREAGHMAISMTSTPGIADRSSSTGSR